MRGESGAADGDGLAPVIPLFGDRRGAPLEQPGLTRPLDASGPASPIEEVPEPEDFGAAADWRSTWDEDVAHRATPAGIPDDTDESERPSSELAEKHLLKKLRVRSLSVAEARAALMAFGLVTDATDPLIDAFVSRGYLDDAALAEQIIHIGVDRKGQGRRVIAQSLAKRGIPRDIADAAMRALPDDDADRALEFARSKARALASLDRDTALRRLTGQLARRGYGGSAAFEAAKQALDEQQRSGPYFV